jgi:hypothetical protein
MSVAIPDRLGARAANTTDKITAIKGQSFRLCPWDLEYILLI